MPDYTYASLYCLQPPAWLNDGLIQAFCARLSSSHSHVQCGGLVKYEKVLANGRHKKQFNPTTASLLSKLQVEEGTTLIVFPVNFSNYHWACVYLAVSMKEVSFYDSLSGGDATKQLRAFATSLIAEEGSLFTDFTAVDVKTPVQLDGHSCGLFVCLKFWCKADPSISKDVSPMGLTSRRLELLHVVLCGTKIK